MPKLNGTGPEGKGPKTGRGLGKCDKFLCQSFNNQDNVNVHGSSCLKGKALNQIIIEK